MIEDRQTGKLMPFTRFIVVKVMGRRDLDRTGAEFEVNEDSVADDGNIAPRQRETDFLPNEMSMAWIIGMHGDRRIAQHRFWPRGGDHQRSTGIVRERIADVKELPLHVLMFDFNVGQGRQAARTPIDQPFAAIDQSLLVEADKDFDDGFGEPFVHREAQTLPITGLTQLLLLFDDRIAGSGIPLPEPSDESYTPERITRDAFAQELLFHDVLGRDAGMVGPRQ